MTDFADMIADMVGFVTTGELEEALETLRRVTLTFATMCSGTEAPLIAMEEIKRAVKDRRGVVLQYKHLFSVEIESHEQAYIEQNFKRTSSSRMYKMLHWEGRRKYCTVKYFNMNEY